MDERDWRRLVDQLKAGDCTPFLGAGANGDNLPTASDLAKEWAARYDYPFNDRTNLSRVMHYAVIKEGGDGGYVKQQLINECFANVPPPDFDDPVEPHALLADFPIRVYLTTNYDNFMAEALNSRQRTPEVAQSPWYTAKEPSEHRRLFADKAGYDPQTDHPIVYHLHGHVQNPPSMVLTIDDYLDYLVKVASTGHPLIPTRVRRAIGDVPLLFIGYSLQDWTFQVTFQSLLRVIPPSQRRRHMSVQLDPVSDDADDTARAAARDYLDRYFEGMRISIFWGSAQAFCAELRRRTGDGP
ncbi:SIR2 family protein [Streptomyces sioyaensis]|uniref:SIR2 family NAD-dependent protein deacylase n=1 Tax=Streptomyces sioyaensis TaxID=67364 RepID=UPI0036D0215B